MSLSLRATLALSSSERSCLRCGLRRSIALRSGLPSLYSLSSSAWRASALRSSDSRMARMSAARAFWSLLAGRGVGGGGGVVGGGGADGGWLPCTTVTLPPSISLQPRSLACAALFVYSLPQREMRSFASAAGGAAPARSLGGGGC